ncbi:MAG: hypothetical protein ACRDPK_17125 [Carbonactinosporaceae bacterium]
MRLPGVSPTALAAAGLLLLATGGLMLVGQVGLAAAGPTWVRGTQTSGTVQIGGQPVRAVRYLDRARFTYSFVLRNPGPFGVTVAGFDAPPDALPAGSHPLVRPRALTNAAGERAFTLPGGGVERVRLTALMTGCEHVAQRGGSLLQALQVRIRVLAIVPRTRTVELPEALRIGSPRERGCPRSTPQGRSPG